MSQVVDPLIMLECLENWDRRDRRSRSIKREFIVLCVFESVTLRNLDQHIEIRKLLMCRLLNALENCVRQWAECCCTSVEEMMLLCEDLERH
ncbi:hypothetical protein Tco_0257099 [Tanacetum coccineum]